METFQTNSEQNFLDIHFHRKKGKYRTGVNLTLLILVFLQIESAQNKHVSENVKM